MTTHTATCAAATEIATSLVTLGSGALAVKQLTPGVATLAPTLSGVLAQQAAIASFPLRAGLGGLWYGGRFPATPSLDAHRRYWTLWVRLANQISPTGKSDQDGDDSRAGSRPILLKMQ